MEINTLGLMEGEQLGPDSGLINGSRHSYGLCSKAQEDALDMGLQVMGCEVDGKEAHLEILGHDAHARSGKKKQTPASNIASSSAGKKKNAKMSTGKQELKALGVQTVSAVLKQDTGPRRSSRLGKSSSSSEDYRVPFPTPISTIYPEGDFDGLEELDEFLYDSIPESTSSLKALLAEEFEEFGPESAEAYELQCLGDNADWGNDFRLQAPKTKKESISEDSVSTHPFVKKGFLTSSGSSKKKT